MEEHPDRSTVSDNKSPCRALWPDRLIKLAAILKSESRPGDKKQARSQFWLLLNTALQHRIQAESRRRGPISTEDLRDLAAEKSLDLMNKLDALEWDLQNSSREEVLAFLGRVARNGLVDHLRRTGRHATRTDLDADGLSSDALKWRIHRTDSPEASAEAKEFADALVRCVSKLKPTHRSVWMFRVFMGMSSKMIARHPEVKLKANHVDVILQRCRRQLRKCMEYKGFGITEMPPGTFVELWNAFRMGEIMCRGRIRNE